MRQAPSGRTHKALRRMRGPGPLLCCMLLSCMHGEAEPLPAAQTVRFIRVPFEFRVRSLDPCSNAVSVTSIHGCAAQHTTHHAGGFPGIYQSEVADAVDSALTPRGCGWGCEQGTGRASHQDGSIAVSNWLSWRERRTVLFCSARSVVFRRMAPWTTDHRPRHQSQRGPCPDIVPKPAAVGSLELCTLSTSTFADGRKDILGGKKCVRFETAVSSRSMDVNSLAHITTGRAMHL